VFSNAAMRRASPRAALTRVLGYRSCVVNVAANNVLPGLGMAGWTPAQGVAYEVAQEAVRQAIGYYAHLIGQAEAADEPDAAAIAVLRETQRSWAVRGEELTPLDKRAVKHIRADADELLSIEEEDEEDELDDDDE
jgi:hypothetical protein